MKDLESNIPSPNELNEIPDLSDSDKSIIVNIYIQCLIAVISIIILFIVRRKLLWLYSPNTKNKKNHPAFNWTNSFFGWIIPIFTVSDVTLISVIGLDGFMMLQTLKMLYRIFLFMSLLSVPLIFYYYHGSEYKQNEQIFLKSSISHLDRKKHYFIPVLYCYIITFFIFYLLYVYYKKFISLRQAYIRSPAILSPLSNLKKLSFQHEDYLDLMNISAKSVIMFRIPRFITTDDELRVFVEALGCGTIEDCVLCVDMRGLEKCVDERDFLVRDLEREIERMYQGIIKEIKRKSLHDEEMKKLLDEIKELDFVLFEPESDLENKKEEANNIKNIDKESKIDDENVINKKLESNITNEIKNNDENLSENNLSKKNLDENKSDDKINILAKKILYSKNKYIKRYKGVDALTYKLKKLERIQTKLSEEIKKTNDNPETNKPEEEIINLMNANNALYSRLNTLDEVPFFSFGQIVHIRKNAHLFTLDLPVYTKTAFVTFTEPKAAQLLAQCLISSKVFTCKAHPAPAPNDVIWENLNRGEIITFFKKIIGTMIFIGFNMIFYTLVFGLSSLIQLENLEKTFPNIKILTQFSFIRNSFNGFVTPLIFNILLAIAPFFLTILTYYEGAYSFSGLYLKLMRRYGYFMIFNGFIALLFSSTFYIMIIDFFAGNTIFTNVAEQFALGLTKLSVFFTNAIIQKMIMGNVIITLKPVKLFIEWFSDGICKTFGTVRPRRSRLEAQASENANFGVIYPNIMLIFPMALAYAIISPIILVVAFCYFFTTYVIYKQEFLYCLNNQYETGGSYWEHVTGIVINSVFIFQLSTICTFLVHSKKYELIFLVPILIITYLYRNALTTMFKKSITFYPLNEQEEIYNDEFTSRVIAQKKDAVKNWDEELDPEDPDVISCDDLIKKTYKIRKIDYPYKGSTEGLVNIMFPYNFFRKINKIVEYDKDDNLGIFKENINVDN
ncbi:hypothetical protein GVAV_000338 [Gurleya vavrai]